MSQQKHLCTGAAWGFHPCNESIRVFICAMSLFLIAAQQPERTICTTSLAYVHASPYTSVKQSLSRSHVHQGLHSESLGSLHAD